MKQVLGLETEFNQLTVAFRDAQRNIAKEAGGSLMCNKCNKNSYCVEGKELFTAQNRLILECGNCNHQRSLLTIGREALAEVKEEVVRELLQQKFGTIQHMEKEYKKLDKEITLLWEEAETGLHAFRPTGATTSNYKNNHKVTTKNGNRDPFRKPIKSRSRSRDRDREESSEEELELHKKITKSDTSPLDEKVCHKTKNNNKKITEQKKIYQLTDINTAEKLEEQVKGLKIVLSDLNDEYRSYQLKVVEGVCRYGKCKYCKKTGTLGSHSTPTFSVADRLMLTCINKECNIECSLPTVGEVWTTEIAGEQKEDSESDIKTLYDDIIQICEIRRLRDIKMEKLDELEAILQSNIANKENTKMVVVHNDMNRGRTGHTQDGQLGLGLGANKENTKMVVVHKDMCRGRTGHIQDGQESERKRPKIEHETEEPITREQFSSLCEENLRLHKLVDRLTAKVEDLLSRTTTTSPQTARSNTGIGIDITAWADNLVAIYGSETDQYIENYMSQIGKKMDIDTSNESASSKPESAPARKKLPSYTKPDTVPTRKQSPNPIKIESRPARKTSYAGAAATPTTEADLLTRQARNQKERVKALKMFTATEQPRSEPKEWSVIYIKRYLSNKQRKESTNRELHHTALRMLEQLDLRQLTKEVSIIGKHIVAVYCMKEHNDKMRQKLREAKIATIEKIDPIPEDPGVRAAAVNRTAYLLSRHKYIPKLRSLILQSLDQEDMKKEAIAKSGVRHDD